MWFGGTHHRSRQGTTTANQGDEPLCHRLVLQRSPGQIWVSTCHVSESDHCSDRVGAQTEVIEQVAGYYGVAIDPPDGSECHQVGRVGMGKPLHGTEAKAVDGRWLP